MTVIGLSVAMGDSSAPEPQWVIITLNTLYTVCLFPSDLIGRIPFVSSNFDQGYASPFVYIKRYPFQKCRVQNERKGGVCESIRRI